MSSRAGVNAKACQGLLSRYFVGERVCVPVSTSVRTEHFTRRWMTAGLSSSCDDPP